MKINRVKMALTVATIFCLFLLTGCGSGSGTASSNLEIINHTMNSNMFSTSSPESNVTVSGTARNIGSSPIRTALITVKLYDKDGKVVEALTAARDNLVPGETWIFAVQSSGPDAWKIVRYDISGSTK